MISIEVPLLDGSSGRLSSWPTQALVGKEFEGEAPDVFFTDESPLHWDFISQKHYASYLVQGPEFDSLGNKSVYHKEVEVTGRYTPVAQDTPFVEDPKFRYDTTVWLQKPVFFRLDKKSQPGPYTSNWDTGRYGRVYNNGHTAIVHYFSGGSLLAGGGNRPYSLFLQAMSSSHIGGRHETRVTISGSVRWLTGKTGNRQGTVFPSNTVLAYYPGADIEGEAALSLASAHLTLALNWAYDVVETLIRAKPGTSQPTINGTIPNYECDLDLVWDAIRRRTDHWYYLLRYMPWPELDLSTLAVDAIDANSVATNNMIAYVADLPKIGSTVRDVFGILKTGLSPRKAAQAWLSARYGDRLTVADSRELFAGIRRELGRYTRGYSIGRSIYTESYDTVFDGDHWDYELKAVGHLALKLESSTPLMTAIKRLMDWDLWPSTENTWDLVPLSFVVDWFGNVSKFLNACDATIKAPYLRPVTQYASDRRVFTRRTSDDMGGLTVRLVTYRRQKTDLIAGINPLGTKLDPTFSVVNLIDGASLLALTR